MKNLDIMAITNAYMAQKEKSEGLKLPAAVAWKRRLNMDKLFHAKEIIDEALREIAQKYADDEHADKDGTGWKVKQEYIEAFAKEQAEILRQETDIDIRTIKIEDLGDITLTDTDMDTLAFMLDKEV